MSEDGKDAGLTIPKFSSFKAKQNISSSQDRGHTARQSDSGRETLPTSSEKRHHRNHHRRYRDHETSLDTRHHDHRRGSGEAVRHHSVDQPSKQQVKAGSDQSNFYFDKKGDPLISKFGSIDRAHIPIYRRHGGGRVLGSQGRLDLYRDGHKDSFDIRHGGAGSSGWRAKEGLRSRIPVVLPDKIVLRAPHEDPIVETDDGYISAADEDSETESDYDDLAGGEKISAYRAIHIKAAPRESKARDNDEDRTVIGRQDPLRGKAQELSRRVKEHPEEVESWICFAELQDDLAAMDHSIDLEIQEAEAHSFAEVKIHLLEQALANAARDHERRLVLTLLMREGSKIWSAKTAAKRWDEVLKDAYEDFDLWRVHLQFLMSNITTFQHDRVKAFITRRLQGIVAKAAKGEHHHDLHREATYIFLTLTRFVDDCGYKELAIAAWQALLEATFFQPDEQADLEEFWESETPRIGESNATGWRAFVEAGSTVQPPPPRTYKNFSTSQNQDSYVAWGQAETEAAAEATMPARTLDEGKDEDPFSIVVFSDIRPFLFSLPRDKDLACQLVDAFLVFSGLLPAFRQDSWTEKALRDPFLSRASSHFVDQDAGSFADGSADAWAKEPASRFGLIHVQTSIEPLFADSKRFRYLAAGVSSLAVDNRTFVQRVLEQLVLGTGFEELAVFYLAYCFALDPLSVKKMAKPLLKRFPRNLQLYQAYAMAEGANGNLDVASKVLASAMTLVSPDRRLEALPLKISATWLELIGGHKNNALEQLCSAVEEQTNGLMADSAIATNRVMKADLEFSNGLQSYHTGDFPSTRHFVEALLLLRYLTAPGSTEPISGAQGNIAAALQVLDQLLDRFHARSTFVVHEEKSALEKLLQFGARLLWYHVSHGAFRRQFVKDRLAHFLAHFPQNTMFLSLLEWSDSSLRVVDETRDFLYENSLTHRHDSVSSRLFAIQHEMERGNANTTKTAFETAVRSSDVSREHVGTWIFYIKFCHTQRQYSQEAIKVFYRAIRHCPWSKDLFMLAFTTLAQSMKPDELRSVYDTMASKGLRLHGDLDTFSLSRGAET